MDTTSAPQAPVQPSMSTGAPAPKKHRVWLWIVLGIVILFMLGGIGVGFIVWGLIKSGGDLNVNLYDDYNYNFNTNYDVSNTNYNDVNTDWYTDSQLVGDADSGYSFLVPGDWTLDSNDALDYGSVLNYAFIYNDLVYGETTNHFEFQEQSLPSNPNVTLAEYSADFVDSLSDGLDNGDFKLLSTDNRTFGLNDYSAYTVMLGDDTTGERNYYVLTVIDGVEYEFGVFYFVDQETQALADFEKVILTFEVK